MAATLYQYCTSQSGVIVFPIEKLSPSGLDPEWQSQLSRHERWNNTHSEFFNQAFSQYWKRANWLYKHAPKFWFPARIQHICIATQSDLVPPYSQPFNKNSWLLYIDDFNPSTSSLEFAIYQFLHVERMWLLQQIDPIFYTNLSYFLRLDEQQITDFINGCQRTTRPDYSGFQALAKTMPAIQTLEHVQLRPPNDTSKDSRVMQDTGLIIPDSAHHALVQLQQNWSKTAQQTHQFYRDTCLPSANKPGHNVVDWLLAKQPQLVITNDDHMVLWHPKKTNIKPLLQSLSSITIAAEDSMLADLKIIDFHSQRVLQSLRNPDTLATPADYMTADGLAYVHKEHRLIAYGINQDRLWRPAPPYERLMLAARTVHEWGHLIAESGWVDIPKHKLAQRKQLEQSLADLFDQVHSEAPVHVQKHVQQTVVNLAKETGSLGETLLKRMLVRIEDYMANLVALEFLSHEEMDTYVRNNVHSHLDKYSSEGIYMQLIRHAYEFNYLQLTEIEHPKRWFIRSTWFKEYFISNSIITELQFAAMCHLVAEICDCYQIDKSQFNFSRC